MIKNLSKLLTLIFVAVLLISVIVFIVLVFSNHMGTDKNDAENKNNKTMLTEKMLEIKPPRESDPIDNLQKHENDLYKMESSDNSSTSNTAPIPDDLMFCVENYHEDGLIFTITADDFITSYNYLYFADHGTEFILPLKEWVCFAYEHSPFSSYQTRCFRFQSDLRWLSEPTISLYIPADSDYVQNITFNYRMHDYTDRGYELFLQECTYAFHVMLPECKDSEITDLFMRLRERADEPYAYTNDFNYRNVPFPFLFYKNNIGLFSCFVGQTIHICVVPVTQKLLDDLSANNVEIIEI